MNTFETIIKCETLSLISDALRDTFQLKNIILNVEQLQALTALIKQSPGTTLKVEIKNE